MPADGAARGADGTGPPHAPLVRSCGVIRRLCFEFARWPGHGPCAWARAWSQGAKGRAGCGRGPCAHPQQAKATKPRVVVARAMPNAQWPRPTPAGFIRTVQGDEGPVLARAGRVLLVVEERPVAGGGPSCGPWGAAYSPRLQAP